MAEEERQETESTFQNANTIYGFLANLRYKPTDNIYRLDFLEDIIKNADYAIRVSRMLTGMIAVALVLMGFFTIITRNLARAKYIAVPGIIIVVALLILLYQYAFVEPSSGSMINKSLKFVEYLISKASIRSGRVAKPRNTFLANVERDGLIEFSNGDVGYAFLVDGSTSLTAYPEEIMALENLSQQYQQSRNRKVTEIKLTSSQRQRTTEQQREIRRLQKNATHQSVKDMLRQQERYLEKYVDGRQTTIVQHLILRAPDEDTLKEHTNRLIAFQRRGLFYRLEQLDRDSLDGVLELFKFK